MTERQIFRSIVGRRWTIAMVAVAAFIAASATAQDATPTADLPPIDRTLIEKIVFLSEAEAHLDGAIARECRKTGCDAALVAPMVQAEITAMDDDELTQKIADRTRESDDAAWAIAQYARATLRLHED